MKQTKLWMLAAILVTICGACVMTACTDHDDNPAPLHPVGVCEKITITGDDLTDGTYYYKLFVSDKATDYSSVTGEDGKRYGTDTAEWIVCVPTDYPLSPVARLILEQVTAVPENTPVLIRARKPQTYMVKSDIARASVKAPAVNMLTVATQDISLDGNAHCGALLVKGKSSVHFRSEMFKEMNVPAGGIYLALTESKHLNLTFYIVMGHPEPVLYYPGSESPAADAENILAARTYTSGKVNLKLTNARVFYVWDHFDGDCIYSGYVLMEDHSAGISLSYGMQEFPGLASMVKPGDVLNGTMEMEAYLTDGIPCLQPTREALEHFESTVTRTSGIAVPTLLSPGFSDADFLATLDCRYIRINGVSITSDGQKYQIHSNQTIDLSDILPGCKPYIQDVFNTFTSYYTRPVPVAEGAKADITGCVNVYPDGLYTFTPFAITTPVAVGSEGYATFSSENILDFTDSGIQAYIAVADSSGIGFRRVNKVPAGTGVLLLAEGGAAEDVSVVAKTTDDVTENLLQVAAGDMDAAALQAAGAYILTFEGGTAGFRKAGSHDSLKTGQCWLTAESGNLPQPAVRL